MFSVDSVYSVHSDSVFRFVSSVAHGLIFVSMSLNGLFSGGLCDQLAYREENFFWILAAIDEVYFYVNGVRSRV